MTVKTRTFTEKCGPKYTRIVQKLLITHALRLEKLETNKSISKTRTYINIIIF